MKIKTDKHGETNYPPESVGSVMSASVPTCRPGDSLSDVLRSISQQRWGSMRNVYVIDDKRKLLGVIDLADLIQTDHHAKAAACMQPARVWLHPEADQEKAVFLAVKEDVVTIPVVNHDNQLLGCVTARTIIEIMHSEHIEDSLLSAGIRHGKGSQIVKLATERTSLIVKARTPWLIVGLVVGLGLGVLSSLFEGALKETVAIAYFIPVVAYIADSVGTQTEAIAVRALVTVKLSPLRYIVKEALVGATLGVMLGVLGGIGAAAVVQSAEIGLVVGLSLFFASTIAAIIACAIPLLFKARGKDPALGSGPLSTALQDVISVAIYLGLAVLII